MRFLLYYLPFTVVVLVALISGIVFYLVRLFKGAKAAGAKSEQAKEGAAGEPAEQPAPADKASRRGKSLELRAAFERGFKQLKRQAFGRDYRYGIPWLLMLGQRESRPNDLLLRAGLGLPWGGPDERDLRSEIGCRWWFFDRGLVIDLAGEYVLRDDGDTSDRVGWRHLLRLLQRYRPKRPIDGIVLTISCQELREMGRAGVRPTVESEQKANRLYDKLRDAQRTLGLRYPVYLLVTGCEELPGFASFAGELPERLKGEILGWSSPYSVETAYRTEWVDEAFAKLQSSVERVQLEMFAQTSEVREPDEVFLFPDDLASLKEPLRIYLDQLFQPIAYHESMLFRGIYFCGSDRPPEMADEAAEPEAGAVELPPAAVAFESRPSFFLRDLFERKIFPEAGLGGPTGATLVQKNRKLRLAWAGLGLLALLVGFGLYAGHRRLDDRSRGLKAFLEQTGTDVRRFRSTSIACGEVGRARRREGGSRVPRVLTDAERIQLREGATRFLASLGTLNASPYRALVIPYSWFSGFNRDLESAFITAYDVILFKAMCRELESKAERTVSRDVDDLSDQLGGEFMPRSFAATALSTPLEEMPEFGRLERYLEALIELEQNAQRYNSLQRSQSLEDLGALVGYLYSETLPEGFHRNADLYEAALAGVEYSEFPIGPYRRDARRRARELIEDLYRGLFEESRFILTLEKLSDHMAKLARQRWTLYDETDRLREVVELIERIDRGLSEPGLFWIFREPFDVGPEFDGIRAMMDRSDLLAPELPGSRSLSDQAYREGEDRWRRLRRNLIELDGAGLTGQLFERGPNGLQRQLSSDLDVLKTSLEEFLNQSFMAAGRAESLRGSEIDLSRNRLRWDINFLEMAVGTYTPYRRFVETGLEYFPVHLRSTLHAIAQRRLNVTLVDLIQRSQILEPIPEVLSVTPQVRERQLREEIARFGEAQTPLSQLLSILGDAQLRDTQKELSQLLAAQSYGLLSEVDQLLEAETLYRPKGGGFDWWNVETPLALEAFAVKDQDELQVYLGRQRSRIEELATEMAQPLVTMLAKTGSESERDLLLRWDTILEQLAGYKEKQPGNFVAGLEELIATGFADVGLDNCFKVAQPATGTGQSGNFFRDRATRLREQLYNRCARVVGERAAAGYVRLAFFFNRRLAGRYPFSPTVHETSAIEADPEALREFFRLFDEHRGVILGVPATSPAFAGGGARAHSFMSRMAGVREMIAPFLDDQAGRRLPTVEFEVEFRVNREAESDGDQVIEWRLKVGHQELRHPVSEPIVRWKLGEPIELMLRWAQGSLWIPARQQDSALADVVDKTVTFRYLNRWSLISFLQAHSSSGADYLSKEDRPRTLRFEIRTVRDPGGPVIELAPAGRVTERQARLFIRINLVTPETREPLLPPDFPHQAPRLNEPAASREASR